MNFGWALTPQPSSIPTDGSTINVFIDGVNVGHPVYNNFRSDIASYFPGYANSNGAVGHFTFDTRAYADGLHTIAWVVTDNAGAATGIGSRYFTINNSGTPSTTTPFARRDDSPAVMAAAAIRVVAGSRQRVAWPDADGRIVLHASRDERLEIQLNPWGWAHASCDRYDVAANGTAATPVGATLDSVKGIFSWLPGPAFGGTHDLVFTRRRCGLVEERVTVRVVFRP